MKRTIRYGMYLAGWMLWATACSEEGVPKTDSDGNQPMMEVHTRATASNVAATLLFWKDDAFHDQLMEGKVDGVTGATPQVVSMNRDINYYRHESGETFSTGLRYPDLTDRTVHATGYAPAQALIPEASSQNAEKKEYGTLNVEKSFQDGRTDFLCCDGNIKHLGSSAEPFTLKEHELEFRHLTSCIRFVGKRAPVMYGIISVNNVTVTLHNADESKQWRIPTQFKLVRDNAEENAKDQCTYLISTDNRPAYIEIPQKSSDYIPADTSGLELSSCYVVHNYPEWYSKNPFVDLESMKGELDDDKILLTVDVAADLSWYNGGQPVTYERYKWEKYEVEIESPYGDTMLPGVEYVVYITFEREGITLQGVQQAWKDGGIHYLPVVPPKQTENE